MTIGSGEILAVKTPITIYIHINMDVYDPIKLAFREKSAHFLRRVSLTLKLYAVSGMCSKNDMKFSDNVAFNKHRCYVIIHNILCKVCLENVCFRELCTC